MDAHLNCVVMLGAKEEGYIDGTSPHLGCLPTETATTTTTTPQRPRRHPRYIEGYNDTRIHRDPNNTTTEPPHGKRHSSEGDTVKGAPTTTTETSHTKRSEERGTPPGASRSRGAAIGKKARGQHVVRSIDVEGTGDDTTADLVGGVRTGPGVTVATRGATQESPVRMEDEVHDIRDDVRGLATRFDGLEERMDESDRRIDERFDTIKEWTEGMKQWTVGVAETLWTMTEELAEIRSRVGRAE
ncbi:unnamed protein product [Tuber aestivum]|uniref:Uncharacterized protein n=1 Tax=Tuber aestivum TaxID=59557 RepID=A0A292PQR2_9PEZI|nr:unnamed protein product [Tuber aestivum]